MEDYIQGIIDKRWQQKEKELERKFNERVKASSKGNENKRAENEKVEMVVEVNECIGVGLQNECRGLQVNTNMNTNRVKSPSDTTIYTPGVRRTPEKINQDIDRVLIDKISNFVESVRLQGKGDNTSKQTSQQYGRAVPSTSSQGNAPSEQQDAQKMASDRIVNHEKFKTNLAAPKGNQHMFLNNRGAGAVNEFLGVSNESGAVMEDDEFFHITCHVDPVLRAKIERGEFVELEKLLPRDQYRNRENDGKLEFYNKDGHTFLAPANREAKITNVRCWEQAFRVYAAIYSKAQPHRAAEIWQYVYVINTAASSYTWENISFYDYTFRQMMSVNPQRSWSKIFNQMWNLTMRDPIQRNNQNNGYGNKPNRGNYNQNGGNGKKHKRNDGCWKFNRNEPCTGPCNFEHKCSYCGNYSHSVLDCPKLRDKLNNRNQNNNHRGHGHGHGGGGHGHNHSNNHGPGSGNGNQSVSNDK